MSIKEMSNEEFCDYLNRLEVDLVESGHEATSEDYAEAARRIRKLTSTDFSWEEMDIMIKYLGRLTLGDMDSREDSNVLSSLYKNITDQLKNRDDCILEMPAKVPSTDIFTRGQELEVDGYVFNRQVSHDAGCGDVYIHPDGTLIQLCDIGDGSGLSEQKWDSLAEYQSG